MWEEFKKFAFKGNVVDMAVGVIIGGAFGKIVSSLVNDIIMPIFGYITSGMDFKDLKITLGADESAQILYGNFIQNVVDFFIIAISVFLFIKLVNNTKDRMKHKEEEKEEAPQISNEEKLLTEIRDLLKNK